MSLRLAIEHPIVTQFFLIHDLKVDTVNEVRLSILGSSNSTKHMFWPSINQPLKASVASSPHKSITAN
jgi:hypothetical protein